MNPIEHILDKPRYIDPKEIYEIGNQLIDKVERAEEGDTVTVICEGVQFMLSTLLESFIAAHRRAIPRGVTLTFRGMSPEVRQVFSITHLDKRLNIENDVTIDPREFENPPEEGFIGGSGH